jgi:hypothetical protein
MRSFSRASVLTLNLSALGCGGAGLPGPSDEEAATDQEATKEIR